MEIVRKYFGWFFALLSIICLWFCALTLRHNLLEGHEISSLRAFVPGGVLLLFSLIHALAWWSIWKEKPSRLELRRSREVGSIGGGGTAAYVNRIVGWFDDLLSLGVVEGQLVEAEWELHSLSLAWIKSNAAEALEIAYRLLGTGASDVDIALDDFGGAALARIGDRSCCDNGLALLIAHERG